LPFTPHRQFFATFGGKFFQGSTLDAVWFKLLNQPTVLAVDPVDFIAAHMNNPAYIEETTYPIDDLPMPEYFFHVDFSF
jgi:hypothetical protein